MKPLTFTRPARRGLSEIPIRCFLSGGYISSGGLPLSAPTKQTQRAEARGGEWESGGERRGAGVPVIYQR